MQALNARLQELKLSNGDIAHEGLTITMQNNLLSVGNDLWTTNYTDQDTLLRAFFAVLPFDTDQGDPDKHIEDVRQHLEAQDGITITDR